MGRELGDRARTGCRVTALRADGDELLVDYRPTATPARVRARHVIVAAQAPFAAPLVAPVAREAAAALARLTYGAFLSVAVETSETDRDAVGRRLRDGDAGPGLRHVHQPGARPARRRRAPPGRQPDAVRRRPAPRPR